MKKRLCLPPAFVLSVLALFLGAAVGCGRSAGDARFCSAREIVTCERIDPAKTQLIVSGLGNNADTEMLSDAFERQNPDVQVICVDLTGGTGAYRPVVDWVTHGAAPDVMLVNPDSFVDDAWIKEHLEDLSANPCLANFETEALGRTAVDGFVYFLPGPSELNCIIYNKTLFDQYGWRVPNTFDEFVALCVQIREDSGGAIQPWNPNAKYDLVLSTALEAFTYAELFGDADNWSWYHDFCAGKATFAGHMEPFFDMVQTLSDNGILLTEHFNYSATSRGKEFQNGQIAMYNAPISRMNSDVYTFDYMPYPPTTGDMGYVNDYFSSMLCVPKRERTDAQRDAVNRYLAFFSSAEGQRALIGDSLMVSNVRGVPLNGSDAMTGIEDVIAQGRKFSRLDFPGPGERTWTFQKSALSIVTGEKTGAQIISEIDANPYRSSEESDPAAADVLAHVTEDLTVLDFSCYIADMYRETAHADIGLINHGVAYRGNLVRLFAGDVPLSHLSPVKPRSFANNSTLVKVSMTGRQLLDALNHPVGNDCVSDSVYAVSGLQCIVAPWNALGEKYRSVKLANGAALDPDALYSVAFWDGSVSDAYITEVLETFEGSWETLMEAKMRSDGAISPVTDGRIKLVWD